MLIEISRKRQISISTEKVEWGRNLLPFSLIHFVWVSNLYELSWKKCIESTVQSEVAAAKATMESDIRISVIIAVSFQGRQGTVLCLFYLYLKLIDNMRRQRTVPCLFSDFHKRSENSQKLCLTFEKAVMSRTLKFNESSLRHQLFHSLTV